MLSSRSFFLRGLFIIFYCFGNLALFAQDPSALNSKSEAVINEDPEASLKFAQQAFKAAKSNDDAEQMARAYLNEGTAYYYLDEYDKGIDFMKKALSIAEKNKLQLMIGKCEGRIGEVYVYTAEYSKSLQYLSKARKIFEELDENIELARCNNNMGIIHKNQYNFDEALVYFKKAFDIGDDIRKGDAALYMGQVYLAQKLFTEADESFNLAVKFAKTNNDNYVLADAFVGLGEVNISYGKREDALRYLENALTIKEEVDDQQGVAYVCNTMGTLFLQSNDAQKAHRLFIRSANIAADIDTKEELKDAYLGLSNTFHLKNIDDSAYLFLDRYNKINEEIMSEEASKKLSQIEEALTAEKKKQEEEQEKFKVRVMIWIGVGFILILIIFAYIMYNRYKIKQRANIEILKQKEEVEKQRAYAEEQKMIIEEKNHEITDSINYAKRIQTAVLPSENEFINSFKDSFVLFKPKDIVSGDFYWFTKAVPQANARREDSFDRFSNDSVVKEEKELIIFATADCTGHGVPGGFMSMLGTSLLNEIINEGRNYDPSKALDLLRERVIAGLKQTGASGENKDGMDLVLTQYDLKSNKLIYSAANNGFYIIRKGELIECDPDKQPIGYYGDAMKPFTQHEIDLIEGDCIYTFTDGYADQFGGPKGKKLKYKTLEEKLLQIYLLPMSEQKLILDEMITTWMGDLEQNDDICLIGVRI